PMEVLRHRREEEAQRRARPEAHHGDNAADHENDSRRSPTRRKTARSRLNRHVCRPFECASHRDVATREGTLLRGQIINKANIRDRIDAPGRWFGSPTQQGTGAGAYILLRIAASFAVVLASPQRGS